VTPGKLASIVVARGVVGHKPVQPAVRFVSPAQRLYAVVTVLKVKKSDVLRVVFQRNGVTLPHDDIQFLAKADAAKQAFNAFADYMNGAKPLQSGAYRVLFYRNERLEASTAFTVG
jgi:hypothetical protein